MSGCTSISARRAYGVQRVCELWEVPRASYYARQRQAGPDAPAPRKRGPQQGICSDEFLLAAIRREIEEAGFHGEGYRKIWARLRVRGIRSGKPRVLRLMRENNLLAPQRVGKPRGPRTHDGAITTDRPNVMWGTDLTTTILLTGQPVAVFAAIDHCSLDCVGIHAAVSANRFEALEPVRQGVLRHFGGAGQGIAAGLALRHDHGSQYMARDFQKEIRFLGITSSPAFVRAPEGNGVAEWFFKILKENLLWVRNFETVEELRAALIEFRERYNRGWILAKHRYQTPNQVRAALTPRQEDAA